MSTRKARYTEVAHELERQITGGNFAPGMLLPTEAALCQDYEISRFTARSALKILEEKGFIERQQGRGSVVINNRPSIFKSSWSTVDELLEHAEQVRVDIHAAREVTADQALSDKTGFPLGQRLLKIEAIRYFTPIGEESERPLCTLRIWIHDDFIQIKNELAKVKGSVIGLLENKFGIETSEVHQSISAINLTDDMAHALEVSSGQAALKLIRKFINTAGALFEVSETVFPSELFEYQMKLKR